VVSSDIQPYGHTKSPKIAHPEKRHTQVSRQRQEQSKHVKKSRIDPFDLLEDLVI